MNVAAIMPCRGRAQATVELLPRLMQTADYPFELICVVDEDAAVLDAIGALSSGLPLVVLNNTAHVGYWEALRQGVRQTNATHLVNLANDLLPGVAWLRRAVDAYAQVFGKGEGIVGFNDLVHEGNHAAHFLASRQLLKRWYGEAYYPLMYRHLYGDTEICQRALEEHKLAIANFAGLFHNHPYTGAPSDKVYAEGQASSKADAALFEQRKTHQWIG